MRGFSDFAFGQAYFGYGRLPSFDRRVAILGCKGCQIRHLIVAFASQLQIARMVASLVALLEKNLGNRSIILAANAPGEDLTLPLWAQTRRSPRNASMLVVGRKFHVIDRSVDSR
ncbi:MAG: hypothetical protein P8P70_02305 [Sulfitobacter sp.]|nr:hypothetical protein [Sulfitobacter sp.]